MMLLYFILGFEFKLELPGIRIKKFQESQLCVHPQYNH
jgi:hypothetical protein